MAWLNSGSKSRGVSSEEMEYHVVRPLEELLKMVVRLNKKPAGDVLNACILEIQGVLSEPTHQSDDQYTASNRPSF